jgi:hypothetical protein
VSTADSLHMTGVLGLARSCVSQMRRGASIDRVAADARVVAGNLRCDAAPVARGDEGACVAGPFGRGSLWVNAGQDLLLVSRTPR